jgi:hypothetical protein
MFGFNSSKAKKDQMKNRERKESRKKAKLIRQEKKSRERNEERRLKAERRAAIRQVYGRVIGGGTNPQRQEKKRLMRELHLSGKGLRRLQKRQRRENREAERIANASKNT